MIEFSIDPLKGHFTNLAPEAAGRLNGNLELFE